MTDAAPVVPVAGLVTPANAVTIARILLSPLLFIVILESVSSLRGRFGAEFAEPSPRLSDLGEGLHGQSDELDEILGPAPGAKIEDPRLDCLGRVRRQLDERRDDGVVTAFDGSRGHLQHQDIGVFVDDEPGVRAVLADLLGAMGCRVSAARDAASGREIHAAGDVDVVIIGAGLGGK